MRQVGSSLTGRCGKPLKVSDRAAGALSALRAARWRFHTAAATAYRGDYRQRPSHGQPACRQPYGAYAAQPGYGYASLLRAADLSPSIGLRRPASYDRASLAIEPTTHAETIVAGRKVNMAYLAADSAATADTAAGGPSGSSAGRRGGLIAAAGNILKHGFDLGSFGQAAAALHARSLNGDGRPGGRTRCGPPDSAGSCSSREWFRAAAGLVTRRSVGGPLL